jgi:hypothetical protein
LATTKKVDGPIEVNAIRREKFDCCVLGTSPLILTRMSEKTKRELLFPAPKKTPTEKASNLKHDPHQEYWDSPYRFKGAESPTLLGHLATAFKGAMLTAALETPGVARTQIGRLIYVQTDLVPIYGVPQLFMAVVRDGSINHTPDIRTRAIVPEWATFLQISYAVPNLKVQGVLNLLGSSGVISGVGDWRPEKGKGDYGAFVVVDQDDAEFRRIIATGGRAAQEAAMANPACYDLETEELLTWFDAEVERRGFESSRGGNGHVGADEVEDLEEASV